jgi:hypothetical protein
MHPKAVLRYSWLDRLQIFRMTQQMKFVVKPLQRTTTKTGRFCNIKCYELAKYATNDPIGLPGPSFQAAIGNVETGGCEAAEPVEEDAECKVHGVLGAGCTLVSL